MSERRLIATAMPADPDRTRTRRARISDRRRLVTVRQALGASLLCFAIWLFLDAQQLFQSAQSSPLGTRRSVAVALLHPIARVESALSVDRIVHGADRAIGKTGTPGGSATAPVLPPPVTGTHHKAHHGTVSHAGHPGHHTPRPTGPPPVHQPSAAHPLTILDVGDSIGEDLGIGLAAQIGNAAHVVLLQNSVGDTGLANLAYYNWPAQLPVELARYHPAVVVVMLGGNDHQPFAAGNETVDFGTSEWHRIYSARVASMMRDATRAGAHVFWVGLPIMGPNSGVPNSAMAAENSVFKQEASRFRGVTFISSWALFENGAHQYSTYLPGPGGSLVEARDADEVHIAPPGGTDRLGRFVLARMKAALHIGF